MLSKPAQLSRYFVHTRSRQRARGTPHCVNHHKVCRQGVKCRAGHFGDLRPFRISVHIYEVLVTSQLEEVTARDLKRKLRHRGIQLQDRLSRL